MSTRDAIDVKVVFLGSASVGKTSIICRAVSDEFDKNMPSTIGACYTSKEVEMAGTLINLQMWDTAGQERFRTLAPMYYRNALIALLVFSITDEQSLTDVKTWAEEMREQAEGMPTIFVIANKIDLEEERRVQPPEAANLAKELGAFYSEVSAKTGKGIDELFIRVTEEALNRLQSDHAGAPSDGGSTPCKPHAVEINRSTGGGSEASCKC
jgi:small GTP-binding protein